MSIDSIVGIVLLLLFGVGVALPVSIFVALIVGESFTRARVARASANQATATATSTTVVKIWKRPSFLIGVVVASLLLLAVWGLWGAQLSPKTKALLPYWTAVALVLVIAAAGLLGKGGDGPKKVLGHVGVMLVLVVAVFILFGEATPTVVKDVQAGNAAFVMGTKSDASTEGAGEARSAPRTTVKTPVIPETRTIVTVGPACTEKRQIRKWECYRVTEVNESGEEETYTTLAIPAFSGKFVEWKTYRDTELAAGRDPEVSWVKYCPKPDVVTTQVLERKRPRYGYEDRCS